MSKNELITEYAELSNQYNILEAAQQVMLVWDKKQLDLEVDILLTKIAEAMASMKEEILK